MPHRSQHAGSINATHPQQGGENDPPAFAQPARYLFAQFPAVALSGDKPTKKGSTVKVVKAMSEKDQTALVLSAAPTRISKDAGVMSYGADGN